MKKINYDFVILMMSDKLELANNMECLHYGISFDIRMFGKTIKFDSHKNIILLDNKIIINFNKTDREDFIEKYNKIFKYTMDIPLKYLKIKDLKYIINKDKAA